MGVFGAPALSPKERYVEKLTINFRREMVVVVAVGNVIFGVSSTKLNQNSVHRKIHLLRWVHVTKTKPRLRKAVSLQESVEKHSVNGVQRKLIGM